MTILYRRFAVSVVCFLSNYHFFPLFVSGSHISVPKNKRQSFLLGKYHFSCQCIACVNDFPLLPNMTVANIPEFPSHGNVSQLEKEFSENIYRECCAYLQKYYHHYPCREIYTARTYLSELLSGVLKTFGMFYKQKKTRNSSKAF